MTTSGSMQTVELVGCCMACSGTVWNNKTWPTSLREKLREDVSTEGQILIKQKQDFAAGRAHTFVAEDADVGSVLDTIANQSDLKDFRALIDPGETFKASNRETVSRKTLAWIRENTRGAEIVKNDVQEVIFFRPHKDCSGGAYCILATDGIIHVLPGMTKDDVANVGFDPYF
jgi:hypothetical protein